MGKILICVDCQYDFIEGGNLPVCGARQAMNKLVNFVNKNESRFESVLCTLDWHPMDHCSFVPQGGTWPVHCVQHTHGAALYQKLVDILPSKKLHVFLKGTNKKCDEYSFLDNSKNAKEFIRFISKKSIEEIVLCGIAGDVCVMNTARSLIAMGLKDKITLLLPAIASLDEAVLMNFIEQENLKTTR